MIVIGQGLIQKETFEQDLFSIIQQGNGISEYFLSLSKEVAFAKEVETASSFKWIYHSRAEDSHL